MGKEETERVRERLKIYRALDNDYRLEILTKLMQNPDMSFNDLARSVGTERGLLAYHAAVLRHVGLIDWGYERRKKKSSKYHITDKGVQILKELNLIEKPIEAG